ncbi:unnamed protein product, partial [marine sediment metagenome]
MAPNRALADKARPRSPTMLREMLMPAIPPIASLTS